jgi:hypothetical protein
MQLALVSSTKGRSHNGLCVQQRLEQCHQKGTRFRITLYQVEGLSAAARWTMLSAASLCCVDGWGVGKALYCRGGTRRDDTLGNEQRLCRLVDADTMSGSPLTSHLSPLTCSSCVSPISKHRHFTASPLSCST